MLWYNLSYYIVRTGYWYTGEYVDQLERMPKVVQKYRRFQNSRQIRQLFSVKKAPIDSVQPIQTVSVNIKITFGTVEYWSFILENDAQGLKIAKNMIF